MKSIIILTLASNRFQEGGPLFMSLILICLLLSLALTIRGIIINKKDAKRSKKMLSLSIDAGLLGLTIGFLGSIMGLTQMFDVLQSMGETDPGLFAAGLKVSLLTATFGLFSFVVSRVGILILRWMSKES
jgi:hypothetical protein